MTSPSVNYIEPFKPNIPILKNITVPKVMVKEDDTTTHDYEQFFEEQDESAVISKRDVYAIENLYELINKFNYSIEQSMTSSFCDLFISTAQTYSITNFLDYSKSPPGISKFCDKYELWNYLSIAQDLVRQCFPTLVKLDMTLVEDPEIDDMWIEINITVKGEISDILDNTDEYFNKFIKNIPNSKRQYIRLTHNIL